MCIISPVDTFILSLKSFFTLKTSNLLWIQLLSVCLTPSRFLPNVHQHFSADEVRACMLETTSTFWKDIRFHGIKLNMSGLVKWNFENPHECLLLISLKMTLLNKGRFVSIVKTKQVSVFGLFPLLKLNKLVLRINKQIMLPLCYICVKTQNTYETGIHKQMTLWGRREVVVDVYV